MTITEFSISLRNIFQNEENFKQNSEFQISEKFKQDLVDLSNDIVRRNKIYGVHG